MRRHSFLIIDLRPPLLSRWPHFWLAASSISPLDDYVRRHPGQARADAAGEVLVGRLMPLDVRAYDRAEERAYMRYMVAASCVKVVRGKARFHARYPAFQRSRILSPPSRGSPGLGRADDRSNSQEADALDRGRLRRSWCQSG